MEPILVKALEVTRNLPLLICLEAAAVPSTGAEQTMENCERFWVVDFMTQVHWRGSDEREGMEKEAGPTHNIQSLCQT